jgi:hypothetical protein
MKKDFLLSFILLIGLAVTQCSVPRRIWPQKDIASDEVRGTKDRRVLVASRGSDFKIAVVAKLREVFQKDSIAVKFIGIDGLGDEHAKDYSAVVILNTCIAWGLDRHVNNFLDDNPEQSRMVILTTSGDGGWMPDMKHRTFDAIASASKKDKTDEIAGIIVSKVRNLLKDQSTTR